MSKTDIYLYDRNIAKNPDYTVWLAFPGVKSFALSSLGYLWMFKDIDQLEDVNIEMLCTDSKTTRYRSENVDLIGFSFTFDMDFLSIFSTLERFSLPLKSSERGSDCPLVFAGGPVVSANPVPYKDFFDFIIIGDGEDINLKVVELCKNNKGKPKQKKKKKLSELEGIYVPAIKQDRVKKLTKCLESCVFTPIISSDAFFSNTFIIEMSRGCANRCGFCLASYMNLPLRSAPYESVLNAIDLGLKYTDKIALLGAQISAHPKFAEIFKYIDNKIKSGQKIEMSVSSLRVDAVQPEIVKTLVDAGQKNITLAIEAGSERLRKVINKNLTEEKIFEAVNISANAGLKGLKFYGMIGLPTETGEDINSLVSLAEKIKKSYKGFDISFGFSSFVPKPNTPFQWIGREATKVLEQKAQFLKKEMHKLGVQASVSSIKWDYWQAVLSRGGEGFTDFLIDVYKNGGKLGDFKKSAAKNQINSDYYALETFDFDANLPWNFIDVKPGKDFLKTECTQLLLKK